MVPPWARQARRMPKRAVKDRGILMKAGFFMGFVGFWFRRKARKMRKIRPGNCNAQYRYSGRIAVFGAYLRGRRRDLGKARGIGSNLGSCCGVV
jgi:hypothetical protein